jgi:ppGpp synthetase/RelA/SpoT-type nucleotidyltranferase
VTEVSPQEWGNRYRAIRGTCESLTARLQALIVDLLAEANLEVIQIEARTKAIDSFTEKISRKRVKYANPLTEVTDLVGLRIITYYREDVTRVGEILKQEFQIDATNSVDKAAALDPDRFGYQNAAQCAGIQPVVKRRPGVSPGLPPPPAARLLLSGTAGRAGTSPQGVKPVERV